MRNAPLSHGTDGVSRWVNLIAEQRKRLGAWGRHLPVVQIPSAEDISEACIPRLRPTAGVQFNGR